MIHDTSEALRQGASQIGIILSETQIKQFMSYLTLLIQESQRMNITGIREERDVVVRHFLDSLSCVTVMRLIPGMRVLDVGSGAGFPGVPLKICTPEIDLSVLDASQKHLNFLYKLRSMLRESPSARGNTPTAYSLQPTASFEILEGRAEEYGRSEEHRESYDLVVSRAVAKMDILAEYCLPLAKIGGSFVAMKGQTGDIEARDAERVIQMLGGEIEAVTDVVLPDGDSTSGKGSTCSSGKKTLIKVLKARQTPAEYPRRTGVPERKPLGCRVVLSNGRQQEKEEICNKISILP